MTNTEFPALGLCDGGCRNRVKEFKTRGEEAHGREWAPTRRPTTGGKFCLGS